MTTVADVLYSKGPEVYATPHDATALQAVGRMVEKRVGSLLVTRHQDIVGIITERDFLKEVVLRNRPAETTPVSEVMSTTLTRVTPDLGLLECMWIMTERRCRHILVEEDGQLVGLISSGDIIKRLSQDQDVQIQYLNQYIHQPYPG